jgi:rubrerythrin
MHSRTNPNCTIWMLLLSAIFVTAAFGGEKAPARTAKVGSTAENLTTAFNEEAQAHISYLGYAAKADAEGYHQVATMFRAIARGEEIHSSLLSDLAGREKITVASPAIQPETVGSTKENLETALHDQIYEQNKLYPAYQRKADSDKDGDASRLSERIQKAEVSHRTWYEQILKAMDNYTATGAVFYVCPDCGSVFRSPKDTCPCCSAPKSKLEKIS